MKSERYELNARDGKKLGKGALIAVAGALVVYAAEMLPQVDFGAYTALAVVVGSVLINLARKFLQDK